MATLAKAGKRLWYCAGVAWGRCLPPRVLVILFAYISLIPFYYLQPVRFALDSSTLTVLKYLPAVVVVCLATKALCMPRSGSLVLHRTLPSSVVAPLVSYLVVCVLSIAVKAEFAGIGALKLLYYSLTGVFLCLLVAWQSIHLGTPYWMIRWISLISALVALYGIVVYISGSDFIWGVVYREYNPYYLGTSRMASTLGNSVFAGSYLAICLPLGLWASGWSSSVSRAQLTRHRICVGVILAGLWLTFSRGAWVASSVAIGIYACPRLGPLLRNLLDASSVRRTVVLAVVVSLLIPLADASGIRSVVFRASEQAWTRAVRAFHFPETEPYRLAQYRTTWRVIQEHPVLGVGYGNFTRLFDRYKDPATPSRRANTSATTESMYLMVTCETGILGLVSFLALLVTLVRTIYRGYRVAPSGADRDLLLAGLAAVCGFCANMATWDALNQPTVRMTFWILVGIALGQLHVVSTGGMIGGRPICRVDSCPATHR